jgi:murein DD-endopeptidase MepM/ murein hydrolase activator NlpD
MEIILNGGVYKMKNKELIEKIKKVGSVFGDFIDGKGFYVVILLCIVVIGATITVVSIRDYNKIGGGDSNNKTLLGNHVIPETIKSSKASEVIEVPVKTVTASVTEQPKSIVQVTPKVNNGINKSMPQKTIEKINLDKQPVKNKISEQSNTKAKNEKEPLRPIRLSYPVFGKVIKEYAQNNLVYSNTLQEWTTHSGIDIASNLNIPVMTAADGIVKSIKSDPKYGITITIEHAGGLETIYSNLSTTALVKSGKKVKRGTAISGVGNTASFECEDQPHLHFEVIENGKVINPMGYLNSLK